MRTTTTFATVCALCVAILAGAKPAPAQTDVLERQRTNQKHAQELTGDLLATVLSAHQKQLEENGLTDLPLYADIKDMQGRIAELSDKLMPEVVALLAKASQVPPKERGAILDDAQKQMNRILVRLLAERERLRMKRKQAELIERITEIIKKQRSTRRDTLTLSAADEQTVLSTIGSQRAVGTLYETFAKVLIEVATWPGEVGAAAADAGGKLRKAAVADKIAQSLKDLQETRFPQAAESEKAVIDALESVLGEIQKLLAATTKAPDVAETLKKLIQEQEQVRQKTRDLPKGNEKEAEALVNRQTEIGKNIWALASLVGSQPAAAPLLKRAADAAAQARESVFAGEKDKALDEQGRVVGALAQLEKELAQGGKTERELSAAEYEKLTDRLAAAKEKVAQAAEKSNQAADAAKADPAKAAAMEKDAKKMLDAVADQADLPRAMTGRLRAASDQAQAAADALAAKTGDEKTAKAVEEARRAADRALGETTEAAADTRRKAVATRLGELNRAAESLDRASAAARDLGQAMKGAAPAEDTPTGAQAAKEVGKVQDVSKNVADGVADKLPDTAKKLQDAAAAAKGLQDAAAQGKPDDKVKPNPAAAADAGKLADKLESAADDIRKQMEGGANDLTKLAGKDLGDLAKVQDQVQKAIDAKPAATAEQLKNVGDQAVKTAPAVGAAMQQAADEAKAAATEKNGAAAEAAAQADRDEQRARVIGEMKAEDLERQLELAREMAELAKVQRQAADAIAQASQKLNEAMTQEKPAASAAEAAKSDAGKADAGKPEAGKADAAGKPEGGQPEGGKPEGAKPEAGKAAEAGKADAGDKQKLAEALAGAMEQHAKALEGMGQGAEQVSGQDQIENKPIRKAMEIASTLAQPKADSAGTTPEGGKPEAGKPEGGKPEGGQPEAGQPAGGKPEGGQAEGGKPEGGKPEGGKPEGGQPAGGKSEGGQPEGGKPAAGQPEGGKPEAGEAGQANMGTGMMPSSAMKTAEMMAGPAAAAAAEAAAQAQGQGQEKGQGQGNEQGQGQGHEKGQGQGQEKGQGQGQEQGQGQGQEQGQGQGKSKDAQGSKTPGAGGSSKGGVSTENQAVKAGAIDQQEAPKDNDSRVDGKRTGDAGKSGLAGTGKREGAWAASLPRGVRDSVKSREKKAMPRGYEERLKKYFESLD